jgi:hypothetical protein
MWNHPFVINKNLQENSITTNFNNFSNIKISIDQVKQGQSKLCDICNDLAKFHRINLISNEPEAILKNNSTRRINSHKILSHSNIKIELQKAYSDIILPVKHKTDSGKENSYNKDLQLSSQDNFYLKDPCEICFSNESDLNLLTCQERFCRSCISEYLCNKINNSEVEIIKCPNHRCSLNFIFTEEVMQNFLDEVMLGKYKRFLRKINLLKNPNIILCPIPDCDSYGYKIINDQIERGEIYLEEKNYEDKKLSINLLNQPDKKIQTQPENVARCMNNHEFCLKCNNFSHPGMECELKLEKDFHKYVNAEKIKNCPQCKFFIKKFQGCNHIICGNPICKYEFCWICMQKYDTGHYTNALANCYQLQYADESDFFVRFRSLRSLRCIVIWLGRILISLICITFPTFIGVSIFIYEEVYNDRMRLIGRFKNEKMKKIFKILYAFTLFLMGVYLISAAYLFIILAVITCPIYFVGCVFLHRYMTRLYTVRRGDIENLQEEQLHQVGQNQHNEQIYQNADLIN